MAPGSAHWRPCVLGTLRAADSGLGCVTDTDVSKQRKMKEDQATNAVSAALRAGYRLIDTALSTFLDDAARQFPADTAHQARARMQTTQPREGHK